jgi:hypothetical protein
MQVSDKPVYQSKQNRSKNANARRRHLPSRRAVATFLLLRPRDRVTRWPAAMTVRTATCERSSARQTVMTILPRAWPFSRYRMASAAWLSG